MASKGLQDLKQQVEGTAQEAGEYSARPRAQAGAAAWTPMDQLAKTTQETIDKTASQASDTFSGIGKKFGLLK
uniref:Adiposis regulatory factor n=1 Tax=Macaca mulatta TaxID=9544 RepID=A0A1D5R302_MACMU